MLKKVVFIATIVGCFCLTYSAEPMQTNEMKSAVGGFGEMVFQGTCYYKNTSTRFLKNVAMPDGKVYTDIGVSVTGAAWCSGFSYSSTGTYTTKTLGLAPGLPFNIYMWGNVASGNWPVRSDDTPWAWVPFKKVSKDFVIR